jgi:hypothetical protein
MAADNGVLEVGLESQESDAGQPTGGGNDKPEGKKPKEDPAVAELRKEVAELRKEREALQQSERYWSEQARSAKKPKQEQPEVDPDEVDDEDDEQPLDKFIEDLTTKGKAALKKHGFLTRREARELADRRAEKIARQIVGEERSKLSADAELAREFPDLQDPKSDLFKRTAEIYKSETDADPSLKKSTRTLMLAARQAKLELAAKNVGKRRSDPEDEGDDYEDVDDAEQERLDRVRAQSGDRGRRRSAGFDNGNDELDPMQKQICKAMGISEEAYKKRAQNVTLGSSARRSR